MKKVVLNILSFFTMVNLSWAEELPPIVPAAPSLIQGEVQETSDAAGYTYLRLQTDAGEVWAAVPQSTVKKGDKVTIDHPMAMHDFPSRALQKTFPTIYFGQLGGAGQSVPASNSFDSYHGGVATLGTPADIQVDKAPGPDGRTVAEINGQVAELKDKPVVVRGQVVKYNRQIMGKNWIHLRDGTGSETEQNNDLLVTSLNETKVGDVVTVKGIVRADQDFGYGYTYRVLVEEATLER